MLSSTELRWFYPGKLPVGICAWFSSEQVGNSLEPPEEREDIYLAIATECDYMGIKLRQGRLEIKWRKAELGIVSIAPKVKGKLESWDKWICEDSTGNFQPQSVIDKSHWVKVSKVRQQRKYKVLEQNLVQEVSLNATIDRGCNVELTQLNIGGDNWWSIALEAFGESTDNNLHVVANQVFQHYNAFSLKPKNSFAYPSWLISASKQAENS